MNEKMKDKLNEKRDNKNEFQEELVFDESEAIKYILDFIPNEDKLYKGHCLTDDDVQYVLDLITDYYEEQGLIEDDTAEEASIDEEDMLQYILAAVKDDKMPLSDEQIQLILQGEFEYGVSIGVYDEEE